MTLAVTFSQRPLPRHDGLLPMWPGRQVGALHVRKGPAGQEPGLFVHGLGGSATNWTDLMGLSVAPRAARTCPDVRLLVLPGVGHVAQMERPETVARAFLSMLDELGARSPSR